MPRKCPRVRRSADKMQLSRKRKRRQSFNPKTAETDESSFSASAKKFKMQKDILVSRDPSIEYRILNFITVFAAISEFVKCKSCNGKIKFETASPRGLGFKIVVVCDNCENRYIAAAVYNEGTTSLLYFMSALGLSLGTAAHTYAEKEDAERVMISDARAHGSTREERMAQRQHQLDLLEATDTAQGPYYGPGIDDTM